MSGHVATASVPLGVIRAVWDPNGGEDLLARRADTFRELDDQWGLAFASLNLGGALLLHHRYADAIPHLEEGVQLARAVKAEVFLSNALINLGWVHHRLGDVEAAARGFARRSSTPRCRTTGRVLAPGPRGVGRGRRQCRRPGTRRDPVRRGRRCPPLDRSGGLDDGPSKPRADRGSAPDPTRRHARTRVPLTADAASPSTRCWSSPRPDDPASLGPTRQESQHQIWC